MNAVNLGHLAAYAPEAPGNDYSVPALMCDDVYAAVATYLQEERLVLAGDDVAELALCGEMWWDGSRRLYYIPDRRQLLPARDFARLHVFFGPEVRTRTPLLRKEAGRSVRNAVRVWANDGSEARVALPASADGTITARELQSFIRSLSDHGDAMQVNSVELAVRRRDGSTEQELADLTTGWTTWVAATILEIGLHTVTLNDTLLRVVPVTLEYPTAVTETSLQQLPLDAAETRRVSVDSYRKLVSTNSGLARIVGSMDPNRARLLYVDATGVVRPASRVFPVRDAGRSLQQVATVQTPDAMGALVHPDKKVVPARLVTVHLFDDTGDARDPPRASVRVQPNSDGTLTRYDLLKLGSIRLKRTFTRVYRRGPLDGAPYDEAGPTIPITHDNQFFLA